jgi:AraC family transcriptional regulator of adaptative response/methylated-DNA-[protein]-cysteine methyltransferase
MEHIRAGESIIDAQLSSGYESGSGFRDAFSKIMGSAPQKTKGHKCILKAAWLDTVLGPMLAIADEEGLYLLEFVDRRGLEREIERLRLKTKSAILPGTTDPVTSIDRELTEYFNGQRMQFETPIHLLGSPFQKAVWAELMRIPYGETRSYSNQAKTLNHPNAFRAVANANGANQLSIIVPCHRIISSDGTLGGYGGGIERKKWLIEHEKSNRK